MTPDDYREIARAALQLAARAELEPLSAAAMILSCLGYSGAAWREHRERARCYLALETT